MNVYREVKTDYTDDQNMTTVDTFKTDDGNEEGKVVAAICRDTGKVIFFDNDERLNPQVREAIAEVLNDLQKSSEVDPAYRGHYLKESMETFCK